MTELGGGESLLKFSVITLFPEVIEPYLGTSMMWKALERGVVQFETINLRDYGLGPHRSVDDTPYGGGDGMLLRMEPVMTAISKIKETSPEAKVLLPSPAGVVWNQAWAENLAERKKGEHYIVICPRYEGIDERIFEFVDLPICVGEYVLTGGELPALTVIDSIVRLLPGVLGGENSASVESFSEGSNLEYPQWTKPYDWQGRKVPEVLLSGNHGEILRWRNEQSAKRCELREKYQKLWKNR